MNRVDLESWLDRHPDSTLAPTHDLIDRCEVEVHHHAEIVAWKHALKIATASLSRFDGRFGLPASETFVTREVCHEVARDLKRHEPHLEQIDETEWLSRSILESIDPQARRVLREWLRELAEQEEHRIWREIVAFTHHVARALIEKAHMTGELEWDMERTYPRLARRATQIAAAGIRDSSPGVAQGDDDAFRPALGAAPATGAAARPG